MMSQVSGGKRGRPAGVRNRPISRADLDAAEQRFAAAWREWNARLAVVARERDAWRERCSWLEQCVHELELRLATR